MTTKYKASPSPAVEEKILPVGTVTYKGEIGLLYYITSGSKQRLQLLTSPDGAKFKPVPQEIKIVNAKGKKENLSDCNYFSVFSHADKYVMTYLRSRKGKNTMVCAVSEDMFDWQVESETPDIDEPGRVIPGYAYKDRHIMYFGDTFIQIAFTKNLKRWQVSKGLLLAPRENFFDFTPLTVMGASVTDKGLFVIYDSSFVDKDITYFRVGGALFDADEPHKVIWRSEVPLWEQEVEQKMNVKPLSSLIHEGYIYLYWTDKSGETVTTSFPHPFPSKKYPVTQTSKISLTRYMNNPIISPEPHNHWESAGTFNPASLYEDGKVHLIYRAIGGSGVSVFGYAASDNGYDITERLSHPVYYPREEFEGTVTKPSQYMDLYKSGGGWGGCEDPKLTFIDNRVYMTYVAFNGWSPPRAALTSMSREDFLNKRWNWTKPVLISEPDVVTKSACLLPEKINGKYVIFHRVYPDILIDYVDSLDQFDGKTNWLRNIKQIKIRPSYWDSRKLSIGATPIKTDEGWLTIYHAVDDRDPGKYKIGAMMLDINDPSRVLHRTNQPIISPDEHYENDGKAGVVYPCGAAVVNDELLVYYGGGDKVVCVASSPLQTFINDLKQERATDMHMHTVSI